MSKQAFNTAAIAADLLGIAKATAKADTALAAAQAAHAGFTRETLADKCKRVGEKHALDKMPADDVRELVEKAFKKPDGKGADPKHIARICQMLRHWNVIEKAQAFAAKAPKEDHGQQKAFRAAMINLAAGRAPDAAKPQTAEQKKAAAERARVAAVKKAVALLKDARIPTKSFQDVLVWLGTQK